MEKMNIEKVSDEAMQDLFTEAFEEVASANDISEFECTCKRTVGSDVVAMEVMVVGLAGSPTYEDAHDCEIEDIEKVTIRRDDSGLDFTRDAESDYVLNNNDYVIVYKSV